MDKTSHTDSFMLVCPAGFPEPCIQALHCLGKRLGEPKFTKSFGFTHKEVTTVIKAQNPLIVSVVHPVDFNNSVLHIDPAYPFDDDFGFFDPKMSKRTVHINYRYFQDVEPHAATKMLPILVFVIACHEIAHLLHFHLKKTSPIQPFPSLLPPQTESGYYWEHVNLGGRLQYAAKFGTPDKVAALYLLTVDKKEPWIGEEYLNILLDVIQGGRSFPIGLIKDDGPQDSSIMKQGTNSLSPSEAEGPIQTSVPTLTGGVPIKRARKGDKRW